MIESFGLVLAQASDPASVPGWESSPLLAVFLIVIGFVFVLAEIFTITFGFFTACAIASFLGGLVVAWNAGPGWFIGLGIVVLAGVPTFIGVMLKVMPRTRIGRRLIPDSPKPEDVTGTGADQSLKALVGKEGRTLSMCRPSGTAEFDGRRYDVVAEGMSVLAGRPVKVVAVEGNRVVVREMA